MLVTAPHSLSLSSLARESLCLNNGELVKPHYSALANWGAMECNYNSSLLFYLCVWGCYPTLLSSLFKYAFVYELFVTHYCPRFGDFVMVVNFWTPIPPVLVTW